MQVGDITVRPVDRVPWSDAVRVFGTRGDPAGCWCQFYKLTGAEWRELNAASFSSRLRGQVEDARHDPSTPAPGLIAYLDDEPVGWVAAEPRPNYPSALRGRVVRDGSVEAPKDESVWAIVCFVVRVGYRRRGVAGALISAAVQYAAERGARVIEGYPVDVDERTKVNSAELYHGTLSLFVAAGFEVAARPSLGRALVTLTVRPQRVRTAISA